MADEATPEVTQDETAPPEPEAPARPMEKLYTKAELEAISKGKVAEARRKWQRDNQPQPETKPKAPEPTRDAGQEALARIEAMERRAAFAEALTTIPNAHRLNAVQRKALDAMFDPSDPGALAELATQMFGEFAETKATPEPEATTPPAGTTAPALGFDPGAPAGAPREHDPNPKNWSKADIAQMRAQGTFLPNLEKWRATLPGGAPLFVRKVPKG